MSRPFGIRYSEEVLGFCVEVPYDAKSQTAKVDDEELAMLAKSENTLTFTIGKDNDVD